jgi:hypothetical protein
MDLLVSSAGVDDCDKMMHSHAYRLLIQNEDEDSDDESIETPEQPTDPDVPQTEFTFPQTEFTFPQTEFTFPLTLGINEARDNVRKSVIELRPTAQIAQKISEIYYKYGTWLCVSYHDAPPRATSSNFVDRCAPISQTEYDQHVFYPIYNRGADPYHESFDINNFAILYMVLALGAFLDPDKPSHSPEAVHYYQFGRRALFLAPLLEGGSIRTIQALVRIYVRML